ncbi:g986 [Coccomyxa elongata]
MTDGTTVSRVIQKFDDSPKTTGGIHEKFAEAVRRLLITRAWSKAPDATLFSPEEFKELKSCVEAGDAKPLSRRNEDLLQRVLLYRCRREKVIKTTYETVKAWFVGPFRPTEWKVPSQPTAEELALGVMDQRELSEAFGETLEKAQKQYQALQVVHRRGTSAIERCLARLDDNILHRKEIPLKERSFWGRVWDL